MERTTSVIMTDGMEALCENLGFIDAEIFISTLIKEAKFDYTSWQREYFSKYSAEDFLELSAKHIRENPWKAKIKRGNDE